jgi:Nucleolar complex-associated protein
MRQRIALAASKLVEAPEANVAQLRSLLEAARNADAQVGLPQGASTAWTEVWYPGFTHLSTHLPRMPAIAVSLLSITVSQVSKLALVSLLTVFKNIVPGYKIRELTDKELEVKVWLAVASSYFWCMGHHRLQ